MSRTILEYGAPGADYPVVETTETYRSDFQYNANADQGGLDWSRYPQPLFYWHYNYVSRVATQAEIDDPDIRTVELPDNAGGTATVVLSLKPLDNQIVINREMSILLERDEWVAQGLPDLAKVMPGENGRPDFLRLSTVLTPPALADTYVGGGSGFNIEAYDEGAKTITVIGQQYSRPRPSTTLGSDGKPLYYEGTHWGFDRYERSELANDAEGHLDDHKINIHTTGILRMNGETLYYTQCVDTPERDRRRSDAYRNGEIVRQADGDYGSSRHVLTLQTWPTNPESLFAPYVNSDGDTVYPRVQMMKRLPYCATMLASNGNFSQIGGIWKFTVRLYRNKRQFSSVFLWSAFFLSFLSNYKQKNKEIEIDVVEYPGGSTLYFNHHRPEGFRETYTVDESGGKVLVGDPQEIERYLEPQGNGTLKAYPNSMIDYARRNALETGFPGQPTDWSEHGKEQHLTLIPQASDRYVDPTDWCDIYVVQNPEGNEYGKPANTVEWYIAQSGDQPMFVGGCILSPELMGDVVPALQAYLCNPADGGFVAGAERFTSGEFASSTDQSVPIQFDIESVTCMQVPGGIAGGAGHPDTEGTYPNGFTASPGDPTGNSGSGVVQATSGPAWLATPRFLEIKDVTQTTATINFRAPIHDTGVTGYEIYSGATLKKSVTTDGETTVEGLDADTRQRLRVRAIGADGARSYYRSRAIYTLPDEPVVPPTAEPAEPAERQSEFYSIENGDPADTVRDGLNANTTLLSRTVRESFTRLRGTYAEFQAVDLATTSFDSFVVEDDPDPANDGLYVRIRTNGARTWRKVA